MGSDVTTVYSSELLVSELSALVDSARRVLALGIEDELLGDLLPGALRSDDVPDLSGAELVRLALFADALYVAERVVAPEDPSDAEASYVLALTHAAAPCFAALGRAYARPFPEHLDDARWFVACHRADTCVFGHGSGATR